jgi:hypothetical protein
MTIRSFVDRSHTSFPSQRTNESNKLQCMFLAGLSTLCNVTLAFKARPKLYRK